MTQRIVQTKLDAVFQFKGAGLLMFTVTAIAISGCSVMRAAPAETTPFLTHAEQLHSISEDSPWDAVWSSAPGKIMAQVPDTRTIYIAPVTTAYLNLKKDDKGAEVPDNDVAAEDVQAITDLMHKSFVDEITKNSATNLRVVDQKADAALVFEPALVELVPTRVSVNAAADIGGVLLPGSKAIEEAVAVGGQAAGGAFAAGTIAFEGRISDGKTGSVVVEFKDRESDPASIIPNYRDFEKFGWSRNTVQNWAEEFAKVFSVPGGTGVSAESDISIVPW